MTTEPRAFNTVAEVADALRSAQRVTALCHENPDADTIGAAIAVAIIAERLGAASEIVSVDRPAPLFGFLPRIAEVRSRPELEPDVAVVCDAATLPRVGRIVSEEAAWLARARLVNVDHHISNDGFGALNLVDPAAAATCEVLVGLVEELGLELDEELATPLLTGIVRDSQGFSDASTSGQTLRIAASLVDAGAPIDKIHRIVLTEMPYAMLALWARMLGTLGQAAGGRIVHTILTQEMLDETGTEQHDADGVAEFMARVGEADVALLLRELDHGSQTRVSVRTSESVDATAVVAPFGGGGHRTRAGCTIPEPAERSLELVVRSAASQLEAAPGG